MKILDIKAMSGPNYWSANRHKLIVMLLDLEDMEQRPTDKIPGFLERLKELMPTMYEHRCSEGVAGGFLIRGCIMWYSLIWRRRRAYILLKRP
jgi:cyanophycin synthetase